MNKDNVLFRSVEIRKEDIAEDNSISLSFSSEEPVRRFYRGEFIYEVLDHEQDSVDLSRLLRKAPLLKDHDPNNQIGVVEAVSIGVDRKGRAVVRFSKNPQAQEVLTDVRDGIRPNVSFAYEPFDGFEDGDRDGFPVWRFKWRPYEISSVSIPADTTVGVGRQFDGIVTIEHKKDPTNLPEATPAPGTPIEERNAMSEVKEKIEIKERQPEVSSTVHRDIERSRRSPTSTARTSSPWSTSARANPLRSLSVRCSSVPAPKSPRTASRSA